MDKPQSFTEYLALNTADKMRLIRAVADPPAAELAEAVALLREIAQDQYRQCRICCEFPHAHAADCRLAAFLARHGEATPS